MTDAWEDLGNTRKETFTEALARSNAELRPTVALTEQQLAEREVEGRERMRRHDLHFSAEFIGGGEQQLVSRSLARKLGSHWNDTRDLPADDGGFPQGDDE
jgi:hypothetical protein